MIVHHVPTLDDHSPKQKRGYIKIFVSLPLLYMEGSHSLALRTTRLKEHLNLDSILRPFLSSLSLKFSAVT